MRIPLLFALALSAVGAASAADVNITCTVDQSQTFFGPTMRNNPPRGPWNFTIGDDGLRTPWGGECAVMRGMVTANLVTVECSGDLSPRSGTFKRTVKIDRQLGTYNQHFELHADSAGSATTFDTGVCQKREAF